MTCFDRTLLFLMLVY